MSGMGEGWNFDPTISLGVPPLMGMNPGTSNTGAPAEAVPSVPKTPGVDEGDGDRRALLANILLSLGSIGGHKPPQFLTDMIRDRNILNRQHQSQLAIEDRQRKTEAAKEAATTRKNESMAKASTDVNELAVQTGIDKIDMGVRLAMEDRLVKGGWRPEDARKHLDTNFSIKWEQSKDGKTMIGHRNDGKPPFQVPLETAHELGNSLIRMQGTQATGVIAEKPNVMTLGPEQGLVQTPGVQIPGLQPPKPATGTIQPAGGEIQPTAGPSTGGLKTLVEPQTLGNKLTADELRELTAAGVNTQGKVRSTDLPQPDLKKWQDWKASEEGRKRQEEIKKQEDLKRETISMMGEEWDRREKAHRASLQEAKENDPLNERARFWYNPQTYEAVNPDESPKSAKAKGFKPMEPAQIRTVEAMRASKNALDQAWDVYTRHPEWTFRSTGTPLDKIREMKVGNRLWLDSSHEDAGVLTGLGGRLAQFARGAGDTKISNRDTELQRIATGIGVSGPMTPGSSLEAIHGKFKSLYSVYNTQLKAMGFGELPLPVLPPAVVPGSPSSNGRPFNNRSFGGGR